MQKLVTVLVFYFLFLFSSSAVTWERLYSMRSTDCFRSVKEVPSGGYIIAGYTADFTPNDTDGLVIRMNSSGDILWSLIYNGPGSRYDCFYKALPTSDGGFILCGYSRSFSGSQNVLIMKLSSSGSIQWTKDWGGGGIERAQDIIQLPNGKYVICGYTTSSPAQYYDAFILKLSSSGNTEWSKTYGTSAYDDANSILLLPDGGFITGGQSNNQYYLIRTDEDGDALWTRTFGTSGVDNLECIIKAHGGDGFIVSGSTNGAGAGGDDAIVMRLDTGGVEVWSRTIGGSLNDDLHMIAATNDGGYVGFGTSSQSSWANPNIWLVKMDDVGDDDWQKFYGGDHHDHGYGGQPTSDGGYVIVGHTRSYNHNAYDEDALIVKTNSSGNVSHDLEYTTVKTLITPVSDVCGEDQAEIKLLIANYGSETVSSIPVTVEVTGAINQTLTATYNSSVDRDETKTLTFSANIDMSVGGTFNFHCYTTGDHDVTPARNYFDTTITVYPASESPTITAGTRCGPGAITLSAASADSLYWYENSSGGSSIFTGSVFTTPYITGTETYYVQAGTDCPSEREQVIATILPGISSPVVNGMQVCFSGTAALAASSSAAVHWYDDPIAATPLFTGANFVASSLTTSTTFYAEADNGTCTSERVPVDIDVYSQLVIPGWQHSITTSGPITLDAGPGFSNYQWNDNSTGQTLLVTNPGIYCVTVTDDNNCSENFCTDVQFGVGIGSVYEESISAFHLIHNDVLVYNGRTAISFSLIDASGRRFLDKTVNEGESINLSDVPAGIYFIVSKGDLPAQRIVLMK